MYMWLVYLFYKLTCLSLQTYIKNISNFTLMSIFYRLSFVIISILPHINNVIKQERRQLNEDNCYNVIYAMFFIMSLKLFV